MNMRHKTAWILSSICLAVAAFITMNAAYGISKNPANERVIKILAQRFTFTPNEIILKKGENVRLEFTSLDFIHGFNVPDLNIRADLPPGQLTTIHLTPQKAGTFEFICDNFCGAGHEDMGGRIIVKD
jgi:cytochrome c oxidase subunit 2